MLKNKERPTQQPHYYLHTQICMPVKVICHYDAKLAGELDMCDVENVN